jgi:anti-sigma factor RsiW
VIRAWRQWRERRRALVCRDAVALMTAYLDGELSPGERARLERHLADCPHCTTYLSQLRLTVDALGRIEVEDLPADAVDDLVTLYRRWRAG